MAEILIDCKKEKDFLLYVISDDCNPKGWKVDLLVEKLSEGKLLLCSCCNGLLRDACICNGAFVCDVCIPEGMASQPVEMNREIVKEKLIYCPLKWRGCEWSDKVSAAVQHLEDCLYLPETCPLGCISLEEEREGELFKIERRHVTEHIRDSCPLREIICEFCESKVKASEMNPHLEDCNEFPLPCPNGCWKEGGEGIKQLMRKDIPVHLDSECPLKKIRCAYWDHGCREEMERRQTDRHEREFLHVHVKLSVTEMKQEQLDTAKLLQDELKIVTSELYAETKKIALQVKQQTDKANKRFEMLDRQLADKDEQIKILTEILYTYTQQPTGRIEWVVKGVRTKIQNKENTYSEPFYVGLYKFQGYLYWDYIEKVVTVYIFIMRGDFDDKLHWPIRYRRTVALINQLNNNDSLLKSYQMSKEDVEKYLICIQRPTGERNSSFGFDSFISITEILEKKYCRQDSITFHISIELIPSL